MRGIWLAWWAVCSTIDGSCMFCIKVISLNAWVHFVLKSWKHYTWSPQRLWVSSLPLVSKALVADEYTVLLGFGWAQASRSIGQRSPGKGPRPVVHQPRGLWGALCPSKYLCWPSCPQCLLSHPSFLENWLWGFTYSQWPLRAPSQRYRSLRQVLSQLPEPQATPVCVCPNLTPGGSQSACFQALSMANNTTISIFIHTSLHIWVSRSVR